MLDILIEVCRAQYYDQVEHRGVSISLTICVKIEKNALQSLFLVINRLHSRLHPHSSQESHCHYLIPWTWI